MFPSYVSSKPNNTHSLHVPICGGSRGLEERCREGEVRMGEKHTVQPAAHGGVQGQVQSLDEYLAVLELVGGRGRALLELEGLADLDVAGRPLGEGEGLDFASSHLVSIWY